jgi:hypothetical protein
MTVTVSDAQSRMPIAVDAPSRPPPGTPVRARRRVPPPRPQKGSTAARTPPSGRWARGRRGRRGGPVASRAASG